MPCRSKKDKLKTKDSQKKISFFLPPWLQRTTRYSSISIVGRSSYGISSKDITISSHVSARLYLPKNTNVFCNVKIPVLVFYDGGGLVIGSAFFNDIHYFLNHLVFKSNVICVSLEYRLAPENDLSILYEDVGLGFNGWLVITVKMMTDLVMLVIKNHG